MSAETIIKMPAADFILFLVQHVLGYWRKKNDTEVENFLLTISQSLVSSH